MTDLTILLRDRARTTVKPYDRLIYDAACEIERLRAELSKHQESEFHPDWPMLEATRGSLKEHMRMIADANGEIERLRAENIRRRNQMAELGDIISSQNLQIDTLRSFIKEVFDDLRTRAEVSRNIGEGSGCLDISNRLCVKYDEIMK